MEHLARDDVVARAEQPDQHRREDKGRRDQPKRRELVAGTEPERKREQRDQEQRRDDAAEARAMLAARVETRLREDEHGDQRDERQPLPLRVPEDAPEDRRVPVVLLAQGERPVQRERESAEVEEDQDADAGGAEQEPATRRPGEDIRLAAPDVADFARALRRDGGWLRCCHGSLHLTLRVPWLLRPPGRTAGPELRPAPGSATRGP